MNELGKMVSNIIYRVIILKLIFSLYTLFFFVSPKCLCTEDNFPTHILHHSYPISEQIYGTRAFSLITININPDFIFVKKL